MRKLDNSELNRLSLHEFRSAPKIGVSIVLDNIRSHLNVGSVFRTADAFRIDSLYLCGITGTPPHRDIQKTALGATESVLWKHFHDTLDAVTELRSLGYKVVAVEQAEGAVMLNDFIPEANEKYALVFGSEVGGVDQRVLDIADNAVEIPQFGTKHSVNIAVAAGIVSWHFSLKRMFR
jgi:23S rRNA (guanosine2251-2'-O)-methyltransferase